MDIIKMAVEAMVTASAVQLALLALAIVVTFVGSFLSGLMIGRQEKQEKKEKPAPVIMVAIEQDPKSPFLNTYKKLGEGFISSHDGTPTLSPMSYVTTLDEAQAQGAKPRPEPS